MLFFSRFSTDQCNKCWSYYIRLDGVITNIVRQVNINSDDDTGDDNNDDGDNNDGDDDDDECSDEDNIDDDNST